MPAAACVRVFVSSDVASELLFLEMGRVFEESVGCPVGGHGALAPVGGCGVGFAVVDEDNFMGACEVLFPELCLWPLGG